MAEPVPLPPSQTVTLTALLIPLFRIAGLLFAMGAVFCVDALTRALFGTAEGFVGWIPYAGRVVSSPLHRIEQKVLSFLGGLEQHIDASMGWYVHALAQVVWGLADGSIESGWIAWLLAKNLHLLRVAVHSLPSLGSVSKATSHTAKQVTTVAPQIVKVTKIVAGKAPAYVVKELNAVAGTLDDVIGRDIPSLRDQVKAAEDTAIKAWKWIREHKTIVGAGAGTAAVAWALAKLGVSWIRCNPFKQNQRALCRSNPGWWEDLLAGAIAIIGTVSVVEFVKDAQRVEVEALDALSLLIRELPRA